MHYLKNDIMFCACSVMKYNFFFYFCTSVTRRYIITKTIYLGHFERKHHCSKEYKEMKNETFLDPKKKSKLY